MRTLAPLLLVATLLAACGPAATPEPTSIPPTPIPPTAIPPTKLPSPTATPAPVESPVTGAADLAGLWWFTRCPCKIEFKPEGTYRILSMTTGDTEAEGNFTVEAGKVTWVTSDPMCKQLPAATYEGYVSRKDGKPVGLRLQLVGSDPCAMRVDALKSPARFLKP